MTESERDALINETLPLIKHIAHRVATRLPANVEIRDLINAGVLGLLDAIENPAKYHDRVEEVRCHLAAHHSYHNRVQELVRVLND